MKVLLVDDEPLARLRLRSLLQSLPTLQAEVVGEAGDAEEALAQQQRAPADVVLDAAAARSSVERISGRPLSSDSTRTPLIAPCSICCLIHASKARTRARSIAAAWGSSASRVTKP